MRSRPPEWMEPFRVGGPPGSNNGMFRFRPYKSNRQKMSIVISDGLGWDHVSVSFQSRTPSWKEMCMVKDWFFEPHETVIQYHPAQDDYVNMHPYCLHMWRPQQAELPVPDSIMVGFK